jgi:WD40 repeat protein
MMRSMIQFVLVVPLLIPLLAGCSRNTSPPQPTGGAPPTSAERPIGGGEQPTGGGPKVVQPRTSIDSGIEGGATAVAITNDGKLAITQGYGKTKNVQIWDVQKQQKLHEFDNESGSVLPVAMSPDGKTAAYATYSFISLREVGSGKELHQLRPKEHVLGFPTSLEFSPAGDLLVVSGNKNIVAWNPVTGEQRLDWEADNKEATRLSNFFDSGKKIASGGEEGTVKVWEVGSGKLLQTLSGGPKEKVVSLAVSADGKTLVSVTNFSPIQVWDVSAGNVRKTIKGTGAWASLLLLPDGQTLLYTGRDNSIVLENVETGVRRHVLQGHTQVISWLALTPDGSTLVSGGNDKTIKVWDLKSLP